MPPQSRQYCLPLFVTETRSPCVAHTGFKLWSLSAGITDVRHHQGKLPTLSESWLAHLEDLSPQSLWFINLFFWRCHVFLGSSAVRPRSCLAAPVPHFCCMRAQRSRGAPRTEIAPPLTFSPLPAERKAFEARVAGPGHVIGLESFCFPWLEAWAELSYPGKIFPAVLPWSFSN